MKQIMIDWGTGIVVALILFATVYGIVSWVNKIDQVVQIAEPIMQYVN